MKFENISNKNNSQEIKVLTVSWGYQLIETILVRIEKKINVNFKYLVASEDFNFLKKLGYSDEKIIKIPDESDIKNLEIDYDLLATLEKSGGIKMSTLIMSDRVISKLKYEDALLYATMISKTLFLLFEKEKPDYIIGSWDSIIQGLAMSIAKKLNIPFYVMKFSVLPPKWSTFCCYPYPNIEINFNEGCSFNYLELAESVLSQWESNAIVAPAYVSAKTLFDIAQRIPIHVKALLKQIQRKIKYGQNKYTEYPIKKVIFQYLRKKWNILIMNRKLFISKVPDQPFFFYGLHMQPESSIDVMAPFYSNQIFVIESIARSLPVTHLLLVKIHVSDADNYSPNQIRKIMAISGVKVVSPFVKSRKFIENASMIFSIQGTIGLEGALLGKPTIMFGDSPVLKFPWASKVMIIEDLPRLVERKLQEERPKREIIINAYAEYLRNFMPACSDDFHNTFKIGLTEIELSNFVQIFQNLTTYLMNHCIINENELSKDQL